MLPDIKVSLPIIFGLWCVAAWLAFGGPVMLAYPAMWLVIGAAFWALDRAVRGSRSAPSSASAAAYPEEPEEQVGKKRAAKRSSSFDAA